jgi:hypothetical protein
LVCCKLLKWWTNHLTLLAFKYYMHKLSRFSLNDFWVLSNWNVFIFLYFIFKWHKNVIVKISSQNSFLNLHNDQDRNNINKLLCQQIALPWFTWETDVKQVPSLSPHTCRGASTVDSWLQPPSLTALKLSLDASERWCFAVFHSHVSQGTWGVEGNKKNMEFHLKGCGSAIFFFSKQSRTVRFGTVNLNVKI